MSGRMFIVTLRQPDKNDARTDPFWEFGSFGCTGCHDKNLLNPKQQHVVNGDRLAFVQGGHGGSKLLLITPPVTRYDHGGRMVELRWDKKHKPFSYKSNLAPILAENGKQNIAVGFPALAALVNPTARPTAAAKFASRFRARCRPLAQDIAAELDATYEAAKMPAKTGDFIQEYNDALPYCSAPSSATERKKAYKNYLAQFGSSPLSRCKVRKGNCNKS